MISEEEELPRVLAEIAEAMDAQAALLSTHPDGEIEAEAVSASSHDILSPAHLQPLLERADVWPLRGDEDDFRWSSHEVENRRFDVLALPVQRVEGHSRAVVTVWFQGKSAEELE